MSSLDKRTTSLRVAAVIQFAARYANIAVQLVITMVLARIVSPEAYGEMAILTVFSGFFSLLTTLGIGAAVVQYDELDEGEIQSLFFFTILMGLALTGAFCLISYPVSLLYSDSNLIVLMCAISPTVLFNAANMVPNGLLLRRQLFIAVGVRLVVTSAVGGMVGVLLALQGAGVYALIANSVVQAFLNFAWNASASKVGLKFRSPRSALEKIGRFSVFQFFSQLVQYLARNLDNFLIGLVLGNTSLGYYSNAYKLAKYPVDIIPSTLNPVLRSFYAKMHDDVDGLYSLYCKVEKALSILGVFISVLCFWAAEELVTLFFGDAWADSAPLFRALSVSIVFQMVNFTFGAALEATRRTDYLFRSTVLSTAIVVILLCVGLATGDLLITSAMVSLGLILYTVPVVYYVVHKAFGKPVSRYLQQFLPEMGAGALTCLVLFLMMPHLPDAAILSLLAKVAVAAIVYFASIVAMGQGRYLKQLLGKNVK